MILRFGGCGVSGCAGKFLLISMLSGCTGMQADYGYSDYTIQSFNLEIITEPKNAIISVNGSYVGESPLITNVSTKCGNITCNAVLVRAQPKVKLLTREDIENEFMRELDRMPTQKEIAMFINKPKNSEGLYTQSTMIFPNSMQSNKVFLDLRLEPVRATLPIEVR